MKRMLYLLIGNTNEYVLQYIGADNKFHFFKLDFVILKYKINIEYNGSGFHANNTQINKKIYEKCRIHKRTYEQQLNYDKNRRLIIQQHGFKYLEVYDYEINKVTIDTVINKLITQIQEYIRTYEKIK